MPRGGVADNVRSDGNTIVGRKAVFPFCVGVAVGDGIDGCFTQRVRFGEDITAGVVGVFNRDVLNKALSQNVHKKNSYTRLHNHISHI